MREEREWREHEGGCGVRQDVQGIAVPGVRDREGFPAVLLVRLSRGAGQARYHILAPCRSTVAC